METKVDEAAKAAYLEKMRHSLSHVLAHAVLNIFPEAKLGIGPAIENGFYYDFELPRPLVPEDLPLIEEEMKKIVKQGNVFEQQMMKKDEAIDYLHQLNQPFKAELASELEDEKLSFFREGNFTDLCRGPHLHDTSEITPSAFKLISIAGAYWKGDEKRPMLTRIYGTAFETEQELNKHLENVEEMKKRDHRKVGPALDIYMFDDDIGQGLPLWLPNGAFIFKKIEDLMYRIETEAGYQYVRTMHIAKTAAYKKSGHLKHYKESMYSPIAIDEEKYVLKPMNCPHHIAIYNYKPRSYRELPLRIAEAGTVYRYEKSGELSGLIRARGFTQNDAHIFCTMDQVKGEFESVVNLMSKVYKLFGIESHYFRLSLADLKDTKKYPGTKEMWTKAENMIREALKATNSVFVEAEGEAAFYGPKVDVMIKDAFGREVAISTIQVDFWLPEQLDVKFTDKDGKEHQAVIIHRAIVGSFERFIGFLIEQYAGAFPFWLSPVQVSVIPISDKQLGYAEKVADALKDKRIRVQISSENETLNNRIRKDQEDKIPYMLIVGEKEAKLETVAIRQREGGDLGMMKLDEFVERVSKEGISWPVALGWDVVDKK